MIEVPKTCLVCGSKWIGGCRIPNKPFPKKGLRVFYKCGASMSIKGMGKPEQATWYIILFKNCMNDYKGESK